MELTQIRYFLAVAESLNFTSAARACNVSQPALSKAIRKLEDSLGAPLFDRTSQQVALTDFGRTMRVHLERVEENRRKAIDAARAATQAAIVRLNVGVTCTVGPDRFSRFFQAFRTSHGNVELTLHDVTASAIPGLLLSGAIDCAVCSRTEQYDQRFEVIDLFQEEPVVAFADGHRFALMETVPLAEIAEEAYLDRLHCEFRDDFLYLTKSSGLELNVVLRSEREDWILKLLQDGMGVSIMPASSFLLQHVMHRPVSNLSDLRTVKLVSTESAAITPGLSAFRDAATAFDWQ